MNDVFTPQSETSSVPATHPLFCITPLSKYLALILFIILPFVGGYVGYQLAPLKVIEVERVVTIENESDEIQESTVDKNKSDVSSFVQESGWYNSRNFFDDLVVGEEYNGMTLKNVSSNNYGTRVAEFEGEIELTGQFVPGFGIRGPSFSINVDSFEDTSFMQLPFWESLIGSEGTHYLYTEPCIIVSNEDHDNTRWAEYGSELLKIRINDLRLLDPEEANWCLETSDVEVIPFE